jgi:hypothetical protein
MRDADPLADMHLAVAELLDRMVIGDLARACSRPGASEAEIVGILRRHEVLRDEGDALVAVGTMQ